MADNEIEISKQMLQHSELSKKIWKFLLDVALDNSNCSHVEKAKQLLKEISSNL